MKLHLHPQKSENNSRDVYKKAFSRAKKLYVVSAYLTEWDSALKLNEHCHTFKMIIGKDFGITRKKACLDVINWLNPNREGQFLVASNISGFHPKAIFWEVEENGKPKMYSFIGSSNLTKAAFKNNYEANVLTEISPNEFNNVISWIGRIEKDSEEVSEEWLKSYNEATQVPNSNGNSKSVLDNEKEHFFDLELPLPKGSKKKVKARRRQIDFHKKNLKSDLHNLFMQCSKRKITSSKFYESLYDFWYWDDEGNGNRLQGNGWERSGKSSNFQELSSSFINILNAKDIERDDVVISELDKLTLSKNPARKAFFSEMLCLAFPEKYPILNDPVYSYIKDINFKPPRGASDGAKYIDLAKKLRLALKQNPDHPAKNLAELDTVIWLEYS